MLCTKCIKKFLKLTETQLEYQYFSAPSLAQIKFYLTDFPKVQFYN